MWIKIKTLAMAGESAASGMTVGVVQAVIHMIQAALKFVFSRSGEWHRSHFACSAWP